MNKIFTGIIIFLLVIITFSCSNNGKNGTKKYKGKLEIAGICSNYTFSVIEGNIDTALVVPVWTDENTGKTYRNAFAVKNPCLLPSGLKEGDTFDFIIDANPPKNECIVCMAYYPTPPKSLDIKVVK